LIRSRDATVSQALAKRKARAVVGIAKEARLIEPTSRLNGRHLV
jgi:hypothetical protein